MTKNKKAEEIAFSRCDVPERTKRFALQYVSEAYAGIKNCRECEFYNTCDRIDSVRAELRKKKKEGMKNMTEQETRGKIFNIIREFNVKKRRYSSHTEPSDDDELADALIAAGIGDVSEYKEKLKLHRVFVRKDGGDIKVLYGNNEVDEIVKERNEYKHRAQVAENELKLYKLAVKIWQERYSDIRCFNFNIALKQAEKELAEESKDD